MNSERQPDMKKKQGFTLIEIMVDITIIAVLAALAIPNYLKSVHRSYAQTAVTQLESIHAKNVTYRSHAGVYWPGSTTGAQNVIAINSDLDLNVIQNGLTFTCQTSDGGQTYQCLAARDGGAFTVELNGCTDGTYTTCCTGQCNLPGLSACPNACPGSGGGTNPCGGGGGPGHPVAPC